MAVLNARGGTTEVDAPVPGTIDQIYVTPGSFVGPGTPVAEMLPLGSPSRHSCSSVPGKARRCVSA